MLIKCKKTGQATVLFKTLLADGHRLTIDSYTALVDVYALNGLFGEAFDVVNDMKFTGQATILFKTKLADGLQPTIDFYTTISGVYALIGLFDEAFGVVNDIKQIARSPDFIHIKGFIMLSKCKQTGQATVLFKTILAYGYQPTIDSYTTLVGVYALNGLFDEAFVVVNGCYDSCGRIKEMEDWFDDFQIMRIKPDVMTYNIPIMSYGKSGLCRKMGSVMEFMRKIEPIIYKERSRLLRL
ncbi:uncharacterized protein [Primulina eburnea]|uniref:uncharacterized protein n=1 Tax=Primulina eburnea TaxID=1245227 RepID=UPI003C6C7C2D